MILQNSAAHYRHFTSIKGSCTVGRIHSIPSMQGRGGGAETTFALDSCILWQHNKERAPLHARNLLQSLERSKASCTSSQVKD
jgi:hypothetical protein